MKSAKAMFLLLAIFHLHALELDGLYGTWESDPDGTREENALFAKDVVTAMCDNLKEFPIVLKFDEKEFSTETTVRKATEKYAVDSSGTNWVKISFVDPDGKLGQRGVILKGGGKRLVLEASRYAVVFNKKE